MTEPIVYRVTVSYTGKRSPDIRAMSAWLKKHCGVPHPTQGLWWTEAKTLKKPNDITICFIHPEHYMQFCLIYGYNT